MKISKYPIIALLAIPFSSNANAKYRDGSECHSCDSVITRISQASNSETEDYKAHLDTSIIEYPYKNGKIHGRAKYYNKNGAMTRVVHFDTGIKTGIDTAYFENGKIRVMLPRKNGLAFGTVIAFNHEDGDTVKYICTITEGKPTIIKGYYDNGNLKSKVFANKAMNYNGTWEEYYESGALYYTSHYRDGELYDTTKYYYESGRIQQVTPENKNGWNGVSIEYRENGKILSKARYIDGEISGFKQCYDEKGKKGKQGNDNLECED